ncbi:uncharacterized protein LOC132169313 [Corylus avellana]|uniref:uncharacterized protein LOC132169313 n=1 Tax=Corylus avellana TaxID=13451 RepID=UPI00286AB733|nr:uncharacterized protein LOC132169313 [Corylus avellana]
MPHNGGQKANKRVERSERTSSGQTMTGKWEKPSSDISQQDFTQINVEEPSSSEDFEYYETNVDDYHPLLQAALKGDWPTAKAFYDKDKDCVRASITINKATALHIAVSAQHTTFITNLLKLMRREDLELKTNYGFTALHTAAQVGNVRIAEQLLKINNKPLSILDVNEDTPLIVAAYILFSTIGFKGICNKASMKTSAHHLVEKLLKKDGIPNNLILSKLVDNDMALIFEAAKVGNVGFLIIISRSYPCLIWKQDKNKMSIFHIAILYRQESVFNLIYEIGAGMNSLASYATLETNENMLHLAGKLAPLNQLNIVSGAALQMQRELLWFKEIEKIVPQSYVNRKNSKGNTPKEIFRKEHKDLQKDGEKWMKDTAKCNSNVFLFYFNTNFLVNSHVTLHRR